MSPQRSDMYAVLAQARFNQWALKKEPKTIHAKQAINLLELTRLGAVAEPHLKAVAGIYEWKLQQYDDAVETWKTVAETDALARLCLIQTGQAALLNENNLPQYAEHPSFSLLKVYSSEARNTENYHAATRFMDTLLGTTESKPKE